MEEVEHIPVDPVSPSEQVDLEKEMNLWIILSWLCCIANIVPKGYSDKIRFKMKHLWVIIGCIAILSVILTLGIFQFWEIFIISISIAFCIFIDIFISILFFIPEHLPVKSRIQSVWNLGLMERFIVIIEDGFYHTPSLVFSHCKYISYACIIVISTCITLNLTQMYYAFFVPLGILILVMTLYVLRFNLKKRLTPQDLETMPIFDHHISAFYHAPNEHPTFRIISVVVFSLLCVAGGILFIVWTFVFLGEIPGTGVLILMFMISFFLFKRHDRHSNDTHIIFFSLLVILLAAVFVVGNYNQPPLERKSVSQTGIFRNTTNKYEICSKKWDGLNIVDFGFFAALAYGDEPFFSKDLNAWFPNCTNCQVVHRENETVAFYDIYMPDKNISVIGVRGTHLLVDWIQDLEIWKEIGLLQVASLVGPFVSFWPERLTTSIIYYIAMLEELFIQNRSDLRFYYQVLEKYILEIKGKRSQIYLTGHSLGGGIGSIVAIRHGLKSITFNSPGLAFSRYKLGLDLDMMHKTTINVIPENDVVSKIDKATGTIQYIGCKEGWINCHRVGRTIQELIRSCGSDPLGRWIRN